MAQTNGELAFEAAIELAGRCGIEADGSVARTEGEVAELERRLGVRLPPSYKAMLHRFGTVSFGSIEIYGLTKFGGMDAKGIPNVVFATESDRAKNVLTGSMVRFMDSGAGDTFVLECAESDASGEVPVYELSAGGAAKGKVRLSASFGEFVLEEIRQLYAQDDIAGADGASDRGSQRREIADHWKSRAADRD